MKATIYLPDDLFAEVKRANFNVSAACQKALRAELATLAAVKRERDMREMRADGFFGSSQGWISALGTWAAAR